VFVSAPCPSCPSCPTHVRECAGSPLPRARKSGGGGRSGRNAAAQGLRSAHPAAAEATHTVLRRPGCRPGGCANLCRGETLAAIYRTYRGPLLRQARTILRDPGLAEEVVQETFVRAWRACPSFDPDGSPMLVWLSVIMRNLALDRMRARGRRLGLPRSVPDEEAVVSSRPDAVDLLMSRVGLREALARLHDDHRTAVVQTVLLDRPYEDVAAELGVPVGTVRSRTYYALRRMRRILEAQDAA
jgi:RNA polymerase sigma-70 factor, ECF subfamily